MSGFIKCTNDCIKRSSYWWEGKNKIILETMPLREYNDYLPDEIKACKNKSCIPQSFRNSQCFYTPEMDTSQITNFQEYFAFCENLITIPILDTSNGTDFDSMFYCCDLLYKIPQLDLSKCTNGAHLFSSCENLREIGKIVCNSLKTSYLGKYAFSSCEKLENILIEGTIKIDSNDLNLSSSNNLTIDSIMSFINAFEDNTSEET